MAEAAKVRLVRCPKCENLLPELPDFSLYQCGGCGAVLRAKKKGILEEGLSEVSDDVKESDMSGQVNDIVKVSEVEMGSTDGIQDVRVEKTLNEGATSDGSSTSRTENMEALTDLNSNRRGKERIRRFENFNEDINRSYSPGLISGRNHKEIRPPAESSSLRSRPIMDQWAGPPRGGGAPAPPRFDDIRYHDEGQSSYDTNLYYENGRMENLENSRAELLRKLDELKDQISRSCEVADKSKERFVFDNAGPPYFNRPPPEYVPYMDRYCSRRNMGSYPQRGYPHEFSPYVDPYKQEFLRRPPAPPPPHQPPLGSHMQYRDTFPGYYGDVNNEHFMLHRHENFFHQPACSCPHCCDGNWQLPPKVDRRVQNESSNHNFHQSLNPTPHRLQGNNTSRQSLSNDVDSANDGFGSNYPASRKLVAPHRSTRVGHPIAGGAPFITCGNCFELLRISRKHILLGKESQKLKCGACSSIILFELGNNGFISSASAPADQVLTEIDDGSIGTVDENVRYWNTCSNDYDDNKKSNCGESEKNLDNLSSTSSLSDDEPVPQNMLSKNGSPSDLSPREEFTADINARFDKRNKSKRSEKESITLDRTTSQQNSVKDAAAATEMDVSLNEFSNSYASQDSVEVSKEYRNRQKGSGKGGESFFTGLIKKGFRDLTKSNQGVETGGSQVFVNGHFIPDRAVKKAEKLAGSIQPGEYWYDKQAGFWGVMGHPCLGIIMPNIEEFNYPMPEKCAAGNTGVFVNGRELHQKDLDLLCSRGLPVTKNRSYLIEINGKVIDEQTGEELDGLGKLAPTVERTKHGFGMKVPRFLAQPRS